MAVVSREGITFKEAFCHHFNCPPEAFDHEALAHCLYPHARALMPLLYRISPHFFKTDLRIIRSLGDARTLKDVRAEASYLHDNYSRHPFRRDWLFFRISGAVMLRLANCFLGEDRRDNRFYRKPGTSPG